jgi:Na+-transporting methylmalonyl-CoA/oxaloacetate decarboxylase gamma subunit
VVAWRTVALAHANAIFAFLFILLFFIYRINRMMYEALHELKRAKEEVERLQRERNEALAAVERAKVKSTSQCQ